jgi:hypothetical protein
LRRRPAWARSAGSWSRKRPAKRASTISWHIRR